MTRLVLDKNPKKKPNDNLDDIKNVIEQTTLNSIMYSDPFLKTTFLTRLISTLDIPIIYLDFDLLYSGYVAANVLPLNQNVTLIQPNNNDLNEKLKAVAIRLSKEKSVLVIDSLNGLFSLSDERQDIGRLVNSYIMFLACIAKMSNSFILLTSLARSKDNEVWVLSNTGRHIPETKHMTKIHLKKQNLNILTNIIENDNSKKNSYLISITSELS